jgi:hypothetical protein
MKHIAILPQKLHKVKKPSPCLMDGGSGVCVGQDYSQLRTLQTWAVVTCYLLIANG